MRREMEGKRAEQEKKSPDGGCDRCQGCRVTPPVKAGTIGAGGAWVS